jgi:hypothetical protein
MKQISRRQKLLAALESYLMANRGVEGAQVLLPRVRELATSTLAYALADDDSKASLVHLFELAASDIERLVPEPPRQAIFAKTLLGAFDAAEVETWVRERDEMLRAISTSEEWLRAVWALFETVVDDILLTQMEPAGISLALAEGWIRGASYRELIGIAKNAEASKPWGDQARRKLNDADVLQFLEGCLGFDCPLILAAIGQFLFGASGLNAEGTATLNEFQKSLKYGLPSKLAISTYESGLADRHVAQHVELELARAGFDGTEFGAALTEHRDVVAGVLSMYPSYFSAVLDGL